jgi:hypothetical protein
LSKFLIKSIESQSEPQLAGSVRKKTFTTIQLDDMESEKCRQIVCKTQSSHILQGTIVESDDDDVAHSNIHSGGHKSAQQENLDGNKPLNLEQHFYLLDDLHCLLEIEKDDTRSWEVVTNKDDVQIYQKKVHY